VHVQRRPNGRRGDQCLNKRACDEATHRDQSTMTAAVAGQTRYRRAARILVTVARAPCLRLVLTPAM
jgi:hypothetical protein